MKFTFALTTLIFIVGLNAHADQEGMPQMPILKAKQTYSVPSQAAGEELQDQRGYGDKAPEVRMMNLMMVEGSGFEGMDMGDMKMGAVAKQETKKEGDSMGGMNMSTNTAAPVAPSSVQIELIKPADTKVGTNLIEFTVKDKNGKSLNGQKIKSEVFMTSMDMGTENPKVKETRPGVYQLKVSFAMKGPWALKLITSAGEKTFNFEVKR
jgi:hypothetical protein